MGVDRWSNSTCSVLDGKFKGFLSTPPPWDAWILFYYVSRKGSCGFSCNHLGGLISSWGINQESVCYQKIWSPRIVSAVDCHSHFRLLRLIGLRLSYGSRRNSNPYFYLTSQIFERSSQVFQSVFSHPDWASLVLLPISYTAWVWGPSPPHVSPLKEYGCI